MKSDLGCQYFALKMATVAFLALVSEDITLLFKLGLYKKVIAKLLRSPRAEELTANRN